MACKPCLCLSSKAMTLTGVVDRARSAMSGAYRCGTALDFDQLPLSSPVTGAPTVVFYFQICERHNNGLAVAFLSSLNAIL